MIVLNEFFYDAMSETDKEKRKVVSRDILIDTEVLENECLDFSMIPFLYSIIARCYFDLGKIEEAIAYSRDSLFLGELDAYLNTETDMGIDSLNLHPLKTQRDISLGVGDLEYSILLQERIVKATPYKKDEEELMETLRSLRDNPKYEINHGIYGGYCEQVQTQTPLRAFTTINEVKEQEGIRINRVKDFFKKEEEIRTKYPMLI